MARISLVAAALLGTVLSSAPAQVQVFSGSFPRMSTRVLYFGEAAPLGQISIQYGQPVWKAEYDQVLAEAKPQSIRLGSDFWTTLDTDLDLTIGGVEIPNGQWFLGLSITAEGKLALMVLEAAAVRRQKGDAFLTSAFTARINAPLEHSRTDAQVDKLTIVLDAEGKETGKADLVITWGTHRMSAPVVADMSTREEKPPAPRIR